MRSRGRGVLLSSLLVAAAAIAGLTSGIATGMSGPGERPLASADGPFHVVPRARCQPGDKPDAGLQGQVPLTDRVSGRAAEGYYCNTRVVDQHEGRVFASLDAYQHCLYAPDETWYGTATHLAGAPVGQTAWAQHSGLGAATGVGIRVLDMSDHLRQTANLTSPIALVPDESMTVNARRGLLVMDSTFDSRIEIYNLRPDCTHPKLIGTFDMAPASGHAGWFSPDGNTYWMTDIFGVCANCGNKMSATENHATVFPIDLTNPAKPRLMGEWTEPGGTGHNGWVSDDGKTVYACQAGNTVSANQVLVYKAPPPGSSNVDEAKSLITSFPLDGAICQNMESVTYHGKPFLIGDSEYTIGRFLAKGPTLCAATASNPTSYAAPEIFDLSDLKHVQPVSDLMMEVDDPANCSRTMFDGNPADPTSGNWFPGETYDTHFCRPDRLHDPTILACGQFLAGLEVYDIRDPYHPRELAYYRPGTLGSRALANPGWGATSETADMVASPPVVIASKGEIAFGSFFEGARIAKLPPSVYPFSQSLTCENDYYFNQYNPGYCPDTQPSSRDCLGHQPVRIAIGGLPPGRVTSVTAFVEADVRSCGARTFGASPSGSLG